MTALRGLQAAAHREIVPEAGRSLAQALAHEVSVRGLALYAALLPFHALGSHAARRVTRLELCDVVLVLVAPAVLLEVWRVRRGLLASPVFLGVACLAGAEVLSELLDIRFSSVRLVESLLSILVVGGVAAAAWSGRLYAVLRGALWGGVVALVLAAVGYIATLAYGTVISGAFVFQSRHPLWSGVPRLTGTFGTHAVWLGEYCVMLVAIALSARACAALLRLAAWAAGLAAGGLFLTFSFAWLGGLILLAQARCLKRKLAHSCGITVGFGFALLCGAALWVVQVGMAVDASVESTPQLCSTLDRAHHAVRPAEQSDYCVPVLIEQPYRHRLTLYALALHTALAAYRAHPVLGLGHYGYRELALAYAQRSYQLGTTGYYRDPIGLYASALAQGGSVGAVGVGLFLWGVWRAKPRGDRAVSAQQSDASRQRWVLYGAAALLLCALQTDLQLRGPLWLLLGLLLGGRVVTSRKPNQENG